MAVISIVFASHPDSPDLTFVEIEDEQGRSVQVGEWFTRDDGHVVLTIEGGAHRDRRAGPDR